MARIVIHGGAVYDQGKWLDPGYLVIDDSKIFQISSGSPPKKLIESCDEAIPAEHRAVLPGLTNAHTHLSQTFMRGLSGGRALLPWLKEVIWPLENEITPEELNLAALLGLIENLRCGTTSVTDHHKITRTEAHTDAVFEAAKKVGLRFTLARSWADLGTGAEKPRVITADLKRLHDRWNGEELLRVVNGPLALWRCSAETLQKTHHWVKNIGSRTHYHVSETRDDVGMSLDQYGRRPVQWLNDIEVLDEKTDVVHAVWVEEDEIKLLAESEVTVVHCPVSNAVLGSGVSPVTEMLSEKVQVKLGTDGPASNDTQDIWETAKSALSIARIHNMDATLMPPDQVLRMLLAGKTLEPDAPADVIIVDMDHPRVVPVQDYTAALILGTHGCDVETVIVDGEVLMQDRRVTNVDEPALLEACRSSVKQLRKRAGLDQ